MMVLSKSHGGRIMIVTSTGIIGGKIQDQYGGVGPSLTKTGFQRIPFHLKLRRLRRGPFLLQSSWKTKTLIRLRVDLYGFTGWLRTSRVMSCKVMRARWPVTSYRAVIAGRVSRAAGKAGNCPASTEG